ncbi:MAG: AAA family ATPase [Candidatus Woesearchaeota archaeon]|nr:MAG: AAA family ATPase [Candidatus Woesearchaeota archaeon]
MNKLIYVISGGPGFGKSALIDALDRRSFYCGKDVAREFIKEQIISGGEILPQNNRLEFQKIILQRRIKQYKDAPEGKICFFDRGIPDLIGYLTKENLEVPNEYYLASNKYRYEKIVFLTPPWQEIFEKDSERSETFREAKIIHKAIEKAYKDLSYKIINVPKGSINKRVEFILLKIKK